MKRFSKILALTILTLLIISTTSCLVLVPTERHDNGKHKGWYKNSNNPHNPNHDNEHKGDKKNKRKHRK